MQVKKRSLTARELVLRKYPNAFVYDDGELIRICLREKITETCPTCEQKWTHDKPEGLSRRIGSAGSEPYAWKDAAEKLKLM